MAGAAGGADLADDRQDDVLGGHAGRQGAVDGDAHVLRLLLDQRLGGEDVLDLRGADAVGQRPEGAVGRGVAVAADDGRARQGEALLGADDVDDALALVELGEVFDAEVAGVLGERLDLRWRSRDRRCPWSGRWSARCGRRRRACARARAPCGRRRAGPRRPAGWSPHGRDGGRYRGSTVPSGLVSTTWSSQILS